MFCFSVLGTYCSLGLDAPRRHQTHMRRVLESGRRDYFRFLGYGFAGVSQWFFKLISLHSYLRFLKVATVLTTLLVLGLGFSFWANYYIGYYIYESVRVI